MVVLLFYKQFKKKKVCESHLLYKYNNDADFYISNKLMIILIEFVCINDIDTSVTYTIYLPKELQPLFDWFEDNYIGK